MANAQHGGVETDGALLQAALRRDPRAWRELMQRFQPLIYRCIAKVVQRYDALLTSEDFNEIGGEVWLSLLRDDMHKLRRYDPGRGTRLSSWLGLLTVNAACDFLRQRSRRPAFVNLLPQDQRALDALDEQPAADPSALEQLLFKEQRSQVLALLRGFSRRDRRFVELYYMSGLAPEEVAATMGISVKTVYSKKNKVRARLTALLHQGDRAPRPAELPAA